MWICWRHRFSTSPLQKRLSRHSHSRLTELGSWNESVTIERWNGLNQPLLVGSDRGWQFELCCEDEERTRIQSCAARSNFIFSADPGGIQIKNPKLIADDRLQGADANFTVIWYWNSNRS
jgi:hypothetical protein